MKPVELLLPTEANETKHARYLKCYIFYSLFFQALHHCDGRHKTGISCTSEQPLLAGAQQLSRVQITSLPVGLFLPLFLQYPGWEIILDYPWNLLWYWLLGLFSEAIL